MSQDIPFLRLHVPADRLRTDAEGRYVARPAPSRARPRPMVLFMAADMVESRPVWNVDGGGVGCVGGGGGGPAY